MKKATEVRTVARIDIKGVIISNDDAWIYDLFGIENVSFTKVLKGLNESREKNETADIFINSPGGDLAAGVEIYEELRQYGNVKIHVMQACSAASVIMCAGPSEISPAGMVMIHNVSGRFGGDHNDMKHAEGVLKTADRSVAGAYEYKTGKPVSEWLTKMNAETWLTASEAVELGLIDKISEGNTGNIPALAAAASGLLPEKVLATMRDKRNKARAELQLLALKSGS